MEMTYKEFRKVYDWMIKKYPGIANLFTENMDTVIGKVFTETFEKRGKKWELVKTAHDDCTLAFYCNCVSAIPFFRRLGGRETVSQGYCVRGYVPLEIASTNPDKTVKVVRKFKLF